MTSVQKQVKIISEGIVIAVIGVVSTVAATSVLEIVKRFLSRAKDKSEQDSGLRTELREDLSSKRTEIADMKRELKELEEESDRWRIDYWALFAVFFQLRLVAIKFYENDPTMRAQIEKILAPHEKLQQEAQDE